MTLDRTTLGGAVDRHTVKSAAKLVLVTLGLLGVVTLASFLPGVDRVLLDTGVTFIALADAVVTLAIVAALLSLAPRMATLVRTSLDGSRETVEHVASSVYWGIVLVAVLIAHWGLASAGTALLGGNEWLYDLVFLLAALAPLIAVVARLSAVLDPAADAVADALAADAVESGDGTGQSSSAGGTTPGDEPTSVDEAASDGETTSEREEP